MTRFGLPGWAENRGETNVDRRYYPPGSVSSTPLQLPQAPTPPRWPLKYKSDGDLRGRRLLSGCWAGWQAGWWVSYHVIEKQESRKGRLRRLKISHDWPWLSFTKSNNGQEASLNLKLEKTRYYFYLEKSKISTIFTSHSNSPDAGWFEEEEAEKSLVFLLFKLHGHFFQGNVSH